MRRSIFCILVIVSLTMSAGAASCTRELTSGGEQSRGPFSVNQIPSGQLSAGETSQAVQGSGGGLESVRSTASPELIPDETGGSTNPEVVTLMTEARAALTGGDYQTAIAKLTSVIELEPNNTRALYNLGYAYRQTGDKAKAIEFAQRAVESNPDQIYVHQGLGYAYMDNGQTEKAMAEFEEELRRHPDEPRLTGIALKLVDIYLQRGLSDEAFDAANRAVKLQPQNPAAQAALGRVQMQNGAYEQAVAAFNQAVALAPNSATYHKLLADALWEADRKEEARKAYGDAIRLDPAVAEQIPSDRLQNR